MKIYENIIDLIGSTPLIRLPKIEKKLNLYGRIIVKQEGKNPMGSAKDRVALSIIEGLEKSGKIKVGDTIIEPTSGNTGIAIAAVAAIKGYKAIIVMPNTMSKERISLIKAYGAEVILTDGAGGMKASIEKAEEIQKSIEGSVIASQFTNPDNPLAHYNSTAPEILRDTDGDVDYIVCTIGTGGTISGIGKFFKEKKSDIKIIGVEPSASPLLTKGYASPHKIQGIGANFIPETLDRGVIDEIITVSDEDAYEGVRILARTEGILAGISSGAALKAGIEIASRKESEGKNIVILLPDSLDKYLSEGIFD